MKILFLEDDSVIADIVLEFLNESYECIHCFNSSDALKEVEQNSFDLYIFDINVPGISGIELLKTLRDFNDTTPAIFITAYQDVSYLKDSFDSGANDFIKKPFELEELEARVENIKKQFNIDTNISIDKNIQFCPNLHSININNKRVSITSKESEILHYLIKNRTRVISTDEILQNLWSYDEMPSDDTIRTYIKKLRSIIGKEHILNIRGEGYRFE